MKLIDSLNNQQRYGLFAGIAALIVVIFLHNPLSGYPGVTYSYEPGDTRPIGLDLTEANTLRLELYDRCSAVVNQVGPQLRKFENHESVVKKLEKEGCINKTYYLPFSMWETDDPVISWFGNAGHVRWCAVLIILLTGLWLLAFRRPNDKE